MATPALRRSFFTFHITLALVLFVLSVRTVLTALAPPAGHASPHVGLVAFIETLGAVLFLFPRSLRIGGWFLLLSLAVAILLHIAVGQFRGDLLIYAAGTWFVMMHGPAWPATPPSGQVAA